MQRVFIAAVAVLLTAACANAGTVTVNWDGSGDYETIQEGMDAAAGGDTVLIAPGTYTGEQNRGLVFRNKELTVMAAEGRGTVTINAEDQNMVFFVTSGDGNPVISGLTIQGGSSTYGGGISGDHASPIIENCDIVACTSTGSIGGGGVMIRYSGDPVLTDVTITSCQGDGGAGFLCYGGVTPTLTRVTFAGNVSTRSGGGCNIDEPTGAVSITDCVFYNNTVVPAGSGGGGLRLDGCDATITGCTFAHNKGNLGGCIRLSGGACPTIENCILSFSRTGYALHRFDANEQPIVSRCIVYGNHEGDDLSFGTVSDTLCRDPRFCGMLSGDLTLCSNSWALPDNNGWSVQMGAHGDGGCGECDSPVEETTWGRVKGLYR